MTDDPKLTPTAELILEVLAARRRLGEPFWPLSKRLRGTLEQLQDRGYVSLDSEPTGLAIRVRLNPDPEGPAAPWLREVIEYRPVYSSATDSQGVAVITDADLDEMRSAAEPETDEQLDAVPAAAPRRRWWQRRRNNPPSAPAE